MKSNMKLHPKNISERDEEYSLLMRHYLERQLQSEPGKFQTQPRKRKVSQMNILKGRIYDTDKGFILQSV